MDSNQAVEERGYGHCFASQTQNAFKNRVVKVLRFRTLRSILQLVTHGSLHCIQFFGCDSVVDRSFCFHPVVNKSCAAFQWCRINSTVTS